MIGICRGSTPWLSLIAWATGATTDCRVYKFGRRSLQLALYRNFALGTALIAIMGIVLYGTTALFPLLFETLLGYPAFQSGLSVSPRGIGAVVSMIIVGRLVGRIDGPLSFDLRVWFGGPPPPTC